VARPTRAAPPPENVGAALAELSTARRLASRILLQPAENGLAARLRGLNLWLKLTGLVQNLLATQPFAAFITQTS